MFSEPLSSHSSTTYQVNGLHLGAVGYLSPREILPQHHLAVHFDDDHPKAERERVEHVLGRGAAEERAVERGDEVRLEVRDERARATASACAGRMPALGKRSARNSRMSACPWWRSR